MIENAKYYAFISYQRKDLKWGDWLQKKLEHYHLPSSVRKKHNNLPKEIRPIFRDISELSSGVLSKEIESALRQSKFLIIICSPNSVKSPWVDKEIKFFIDNGREESIIPFIIEGTPYSNQSDKECFPPSLRLLRDNRELLGININEMGRDAAAIKVISRMLGLDFDTLWQRHEKEKRRKRTVWIFAAFVIAALSLGIGTYFFKQNNIIKRQKQDLEIAANQLRDDSVTLSMHLAHIQKDSLLLSAQKDSLQKTLFQLNEANANLIKERNGMLAAQARAAAERTYKLVQEGDLYSAELLALEVLPGSSSNPNRPYTAEAEIALRNIRHQFDTSTYKSVSKLRGDKRSLSYYDDVLSPTGERILFWDNGFLYLHNVLSGEEIRLSGDALPDIQSFGFNKQGDKAYAVTHRPYYYPLYEKNWDLKLTVWDVQTNRIVKVLTFDTDYGDEENAIEDVLKRVDRSFVYASPDNSCKSISITENENNQLVIQEVSTLDEIMRLNVGEYSSWEFGCHPTKPEISVAISDTLFVIDTYNKVIEQRIPQPYCDYFSVRYNKTGDRLIVGDYVYSRESSDKLHHINFTDFENVTCISFSKDDKQVALGRGDGTILLVDASTRKELFRIAGDSLKLTDVDFSPDGKWLLALHSDDNFISVIELWNLQNRRITCSKEIHYPCLKTAFRDDGKGFFVWGETKVYVYSTESNRLTLTHKHSFEDTYINDIIWYKGNNLLLTDGTDLFEWELNSGTVNRHRGFHVATSGNGQDHIADVIPLQNNNLLLFAGQGRHRIINGANCAVIRTFDPVVYCEGLPHCDCYNMISQVSPDKSRLITVSNSGYVREYDVGSGILLQEIDLFPEIYHDTMPMYFFSRTGYIVEAGEIDHRGQRIILKLENGEVIVVTLDSLQAIMEDARRHLRGRKLTPDEMVKYNLR